MGLIMIISTLVLMAPIALVACVGVWALGRDSGWW
jgi:hypothetical protein